MLISDILMAVN